MASRASLGDDRREHTELDGLLVRSGAGDADAFAELYDHLAPRVFGMVTSAVQDATAAEDVTCEAFVEAWRRSPTYDPERCSAAAWVLVLAHRMAARAGRLSGPTTGRQASAPSVDESYFSGLDHRRIETAVDCDQPATVVLTDALRILTPSPTPR